MDSWYQSPLKADDIRHDMGLIDDLIGQVQRLVSTVGRKGTKKKVGSLSEKGFDFCDVTFGASDIMQMDAVGD